MGERARDQGSPNARTALAWQRTALALVVATAVVARLNADRLGPPALVTMAVALLLSLWVLGESRSRYAHDAGARSRGRDRSGRAPMALAAAVVLIALVELAGIVVG